MSKKGAVLLLVLIIMAAAVIGVITIEEWASKNYGVSENLYVDNQAAFYFHSALKVAKKLLENDNNKYDSEKDDWANLPPFRVNDETIVYMKIIPANEKININNLTNPNKYISQRTEKAMKLILGYSYPDPQKIIDTIKDWMNDNITYSSYYLRYKPIKGPLFSLKEIDFIPGIKNFSKRFHNFFTVCTSLSKININFASAKTMEAYVPELDNCVDNIIKQRDKNPFQNITQIRKLDCISDTSYIKILPYITTSSNIFIVKISVTINGIEKNAEALLSRNGGAVRIIKYFEGKGFYE